MKKSNLISICALVLILLTLVGYDCRLRAEYLSGNYKNIYRNFVTLKFKDFDSANLVSSTVANVKFIQGPFKVMVDSDALRYVKVSQKGKQLMISADFSSEERYNANPYIILISCPMLVNVKASAIYTVNKKPIIDSASNAGWDRRAILIDGFKQDSLTLQQDYGSTIVLAKNNIGSVHAGVGNSPGSSSKIIIADSNILKNARLDINTASILLLQNARIGNLSYHLADSAKMTISGAMVKKAL